MASKNRAALITKVLKVVKKHFKPAAPPKDRSLLQHLLYACCLENSSYETAEKTFACLALWSLATLLGMPARLAEGTGLRWRLSRPSCDCLVWKDCLTNLASVSSNAREPWVRSGVLGMGQPPTLALSEKRSPGFAEAA